MIPIFAVGDVDTAVRLLGGKAVLVSHAYLGTSWVPLRGDGVTLRDLLRVARLTWCDCGAFTRWQRRLKKQCEACGKSGYLPGTLCASCVERGAVLLSVESWAAFICEHADDFDRFVALDQIDDAEASVCNWRRLLQLLPARLHAKLVPVWHEGDPLEHLAEYDPAARLVALGRTKGRQAGAAGHKASRVFYDAAFNAYPDGLFHGLGNGNASLLELYPWESYDASSWQRDSAYGESHGWPWSAVTKETRMRAYIEAFESVRYRPREPAKQSTFPWAEDLHVLEAR